MLSKANALETAALDVGSITGNNWKLEGIKLSLDGINQKKPQLKLSATKLKLPKPFDDLTLADFHCDNFTWHNNEILCKQGRASVRSVYWQSPTTNFFFHLSPKKNSFKLQDARLVGSRLTLEAQMQGENWQFKVDGKNINNTLTDKLFQTRLTKAKKSQAKQGYLNLTGTFSGRQKTIGEFDVAVEVDGLTDQTKDGKVAVEKLNALIHLAGKKDKELWYWQSETKMNGGALYVEPIYLEAGQQAIVLNAQGLWNNNSKQAEIQSFTYQHPDAGGLTGNAKGYCRDNINIDTADVTLQSNTMQGLLITYISPFFTESPFAGVAVNGDLTARLSFRQQKLTDASINFSKLNVNDEAGRLAIEEGSGLIDWSDNPLQTKQSELAWQKLAIRGMPMAAAKLKFASEANHFRLAEKVNLPFLNGTIAVDKFSWQGKQNEEPDVSFAGSLANVSLEQLSKTLGWGSLSGNISGQIPGVNYHNKTLSLDGELLIKVFDGTVKVNHLASSGLFSSLPNVVGDVEIDNLDLEQLTQKFEFGSITGRLSGYVNKLALENWRPITFFAWLGTPNNDDSSHTISQKAVKNIASIGGGGASDVLSRSFLGMFETFRYDKIGVGCYLHDGVCQMMGLQATVQGYYLIKGGWLPRIDVLGYNSRVNWDVLMERLGRVVSSDKVIVQ